ncbi:hypothetical protein KIPB_014087, partial [Kipferlia bialata]|eukprot:g14087.t1
MSQPYVASNPAVFALCGARESRYSSVELQGPLLAIGCLPCVFTVHCEGTYVTMFYFEATVDLLLEPTMYNGWT